MFAYIVFAAAKRRQLGIKYNLKDVQPWKRTLAILPRLTFLIFINFKISFFE